MAAIVYQTSKKTGITYAYESVSWDKKKQQSRAKRKCLGRVDPETREIIPTRKKAVAAQKADAGKRRPVPITDVSRSFYGATYLFDSIGEKIGITADLKKCFPDTYKQLLSMAYYLILEDKNPLSRFPRWRLRISTLSGRPFRRNEAVSCLLPSLKNPVSISFACRGNAE